MHIVIKPNILPMVLRNRLKSSLKQTDYYQILFIFKEQYIDNNQHVEHGYS